jgi:hypothetical protein
MNEGSGTLVFWILIPLFGAIGLYLILYSRLRKKMVEAFAKSHHFQIKPEYREQVQETLDRCFSLEGKGLLRSFDQLSSLVDGKPIWLFRAVELLDLNPYAQSESTHFARIVALFDIPVVYDEFFVLDKSMQASHRLPTSRSPNPEILEIVKRIVVSCKPRHPLSVTLKGGHGLVYFEPLITGGEKASDIDSLYCIAKKMRENLSDDV